MKNISVNSEFLEIDTDSENFLSSKIAYDNIDQSIFLALQYSTQTSLYKIKNKKHELHTIIGSDIIQHSSTSNILSFTVIDDLLCLVYSSGDMLTITTSKEIDIDIVGSIESGISSAEWSLNSDLLIIITKTNNIIQLSSNFDLINEFPMLLDNDGELKQVSIGWGNKETQFHGSMGKNSIKTNTCFSFSKNDDSSTKIAWRADGNYFGVSSVHSNSNSNSDDLSIRSIRVFNRDGVLQSVSEMVPQLEHSLSWRPAGNLIASSQLLPNKLDIIFFEKNGLRHGEFTLTTDLSTKIIDISWNCDSTLIAVHFSTESKHYVQFWSMGNYHYYLKHQIESTHFLYTGWNPENPLEFFTYSIDSRITHYTLSWKTSLSSSLSKLNPSTVAVVDGKCLMTTPFRRVNIPPPMSLSKFNTPSPVNEVSFSPGNHGDDFILLLSDHSIQFYRSNVTLKLDVNSSTHTLLTHYNLPKHLYGIRQVHWESDNRLVCVQSKPNLKHTYSFDSLLFIDLCFDESNNVTIVNEISIPTEYSILLVGLDCDTKHLYFETENGSIYSIKDTKFNQECQLPQFCPTVSYTLINNQPAYFGLSQRNQLYLNNVCLLNDCTSFSLQQEFLIATTLSHTVRFLPFQDDIHSIRFPDIIPQDKDKPNQFNESIRRVERGSQIVCAIPNSISLVLQMPRGNLETIYPRYLVLSAVRNHLDLSQYKEAFILCRKHRIDFNILYDYDPCRFTPEVWKQFIMDINDMEYLSLFVSALKDIDYCNQNSIKEGKVNLICKEMISIFECFNIPFIQTLLVLMVKQSPPELERAMSKILEIKSRSNDEAEEALKYIIFLVNADKLYDISLGMYDFSLVLLVAQHSQKDPREYLPWLKTLEKLEPNLQKFTIDDYLNLYEKALNWLSKTQTSFDIVLEYIKKHSLFKLGMKIYESKSIEYHKIVELFANHLSLNNQYYESGLLYEFIDDKKSALEQYKLAVAWKQGLVLVSNDPESFDISIKELAISYSELLIEKRCFNDAARIQIDYLNNIEKAIDILLSTHHWNEALRVLSLYKPSQLLDTNIVSIVVKEYERFISDMNETLITFQSQTSRLKIVREKKNERIENYGECMDDIDMLSDTSSMATTRITQSSFMSQSSARTGKTSRQKRKLERKKNSSRKGGIFEEEYLINSLKQIHQKFIDLKDDVQMICDVLVRFKKMNEAKRVCIVWKESFLECRKYMNDEDGKEGCLDDDVISDVGFSFF